MLSLGLLSVGLGTAVRAQMVVVNVGINQPAALVADAGNPTGLEICEGDSIFLGGNPTALGGTAPYAYVWSPGTNLSSTTVANPLASPGTPTSYSLQVTDANNCTSTGSVSVAVNSIPLSAFLETQNGLVVTFSDQSSGTITDWLWDFGDGNTSTQQNPVHTYAAPGQYTVCLTASNNGCGQESCIVLTVLVGIEDALAIQGLQVFPNPYQGATNLQFTMTEAEDVKLEAFDLQGKRIGLVFQGPLNAGTQTLKFSAADFGAAAGVYMLRLSVGDAQATVRVHEVH